jgi:hypothetical protein
VDQEQETKERVDEIARAREEKGLETGSYSDSRVLDQLIGVQFEHPCCHLVQESRTVVTVSSSQFIIHENSKIKNKIHINTHLG